MFKLSTTFLLFAALFHGSFAVPGKDEKLGGVMAMEVASLSHDEKLGLMALLLEDPELKETVKQQHNIGALEKTGSAHELNVKEQVCCCARTRRCRRTYLSGP